MLRGTPRQKIINGRKMLITSEKGSLGTGALSTETEVKAQQKPRKMETKLTTIWVMPFILLGLFLMPKTINHGVNQG